MQRAAREEINCNDSTQTSEVKLMCFKEFSEKTGKMKNFTIRDMFIRQLVSLKTLSIDKALAIAEIYPTPQSLFTAYEKCFDESEALDLIANIRFGKLRRPIGSVISKILYDFYNLNSYALPNE